VGLEAAEGEQGGGEPKDAGPCSAAAAVVVVAISWWASRV